MGPGRWGWAGLAELVAGVDPLPFAGLPQLHTTLGACKCGGRPRASLERVEGPTAVTSNSGEAKAKKIKIKKTRTEDGGRKGKGFRVRGDFGNKTKRKGGLDRQPSPRSRESLFVGSPIVVNLRGDYLSIFGRKRRRRRRGSFVTLSYDSLSLLFFSTAVFC